MIGEEGKWRKVTVAEARKNLDQLISWRPGMQFASLENPNEDPALILEDIREFKSTKTKR